MQAERSIDGNVFDSLARGGGADARVVVRPVFCDSLSQ